MVTQCELAHGYRGCLLSLQVPRCSPPCLARLLRRLNVNLFGRKMKSPEVEGLGATGASSPAWIGTTAGGSSPGGLVGCPLFGFGLSGRWGHSPQPSPPKGCEAAVAFA